MIRIVKFHIILMKAIMMQRFLLEFERIDLKLLLEFSQLLPWYLVHMVGSILVAYFASRYFNVIGSGDEYMGILVVFIQHK